MTSITSDAPSRPVSSSDSEPKEHPGLKMVSWYDPLMLAKLGADAFISATIGHRADRRLMDALESPEVRPYDCSRDADGNPREELWFDYVADLGDGWDSTYAVAQAVTSPTLTVTDETGATHETQGGSLLVLGGDQVYPSASVKSYEERTLTPWRLALGSQRSPPDVFAIPGNHDWYDGLVSFTRLFCQGREPVGWKTHQRRSYFAVKLPHGWWLLGTDMQLESDLDHPQVQYFQRLAGHIGENDRILLCLAEPAWLSAHSRPMVDRSCLERNLDFLEKVLGKKVSVFLAGDSHYYRRHADAEGRQKIVAGGGGAFLHPTHVPRKQAPLSGGFTQRKLFPSAEESRKLSWRNLGFAAINPRFGVLTGLLYMLLAWSFSLNISSADAPRAAGLVLNTAFSSPGLILVLSMVLFGLMGFADKGFGRWRWLAGLMHWLGHMTAAFLIAWGTAHLLHSVWGMDFHDHGRTPLRLAIMFAGGFLAGPTIMGLYLLISLNVFSAHTNEAFSSLAIADWKNFLRLHITPDGRLHIYPIGLRRVPRAWKRGEKARGPEWVANDTHATPPELIEPPLVV